MSNGLNKPVLECGPQRIAPGKPGGTYYIALTFKEQKALLGPQKSHMPHASRSVCKMW